MSYIRLGFAALLLSLAGPAVAAPEPPPEALAKKMLEATKNNQYDAFMAEVDDGMRAAITKQQFEGVSGMLAPRLKQGYKLVYLERLRKATTTVFLWKLVFTDGKDDALVQLARDPKGRVSGFLIQ